MGSVKRNFSALPTRQRRYQRSTERGRLQTASRGGPARVFGVFSLSMCGWETEFARPARHLLGKIKTSQMIQRDLRAAGIPYQDDQDRFRDFHALRHTTGSWLTAQGVHPKVIQRIMSHSVITLTMDRYTHIHVDDERDALERLPSTAGSQSSRDQAGELAATGTEDSLGENRRESGGRKVQRARQDKRAHGHMVAFQDAAESPHDTTPRDDDAEARDVTPRKTRRLGTHRHSKSRDDTNAPPQDSNLEPAD